MSGRPARDQIVSPRGMSLLELVLALAITAVLMGSLGAALAVASRALPTEASATADAATGTEALTALLANVRVATQFETGFDATSVTFRVPDRDDDGVTEILRYAWSGTAGDPLTIEVNRGNPVVLAEDVHHLDLSYVSTVVSGTGGVDASSGRSLDVLFVVRQASNLHASELFRKFLFESFGHHVTVLSEDALPSEWTAAIAKNRVAYISDRANENDVCPMLFEATIGVMTEHRHTPDALGLSEKPFGSDAMTSILIDDNSHYITKPFFPGLLPIFTDNDAVATSGGDPLAPGASPLASEPSRPDRRVLVLVDRGQPLFGGQPAKGRRVMLPWGNNNDLSLLTRSGSTILERAFEWAGDAERQDDEASPLFSQLPDAGGTSKDHSIDWDDWAAASIVPDLPDGAVGWKVTRFRFLGQRDGLADGTLVAQVRGRDASGRPTDDILDQVYLHEENLPVAYDWVEITFDPPDWIAASEGACITIGMLAGDGGGEILYQEGMGAVTPANQFYKGPPDDWDVNDNRDIPCEVDGAVQMPLE